MAESNTVATLNGLFKELYADKLENLIPDGVKLMNKIAFLSKDKTLGNFYHQPVVLGLEHGVTYNNGDGSAFSLNDAVAGTIRDAQVRGNELVLRSRLSLGAASRSMSGGAKAFMDGTKFLVTNMVRSLAKKLEVEILYGGKNWGIVEGAPAGLVVTIETAQWASGIWAGGENMPVDVYSPDASTEGPGATLRVSTVVTAVDISLRKLTLAAVTGIVDGDVIIPKGAKDMEFAGIHKILRNSSTLFNIDASAFSLWKGNEYDAGGAQLSFSKINSAIELAVAKGLEDDLSIYVNPKTWANLLSDQAALRRYDSSFKSSEMDNGAKSIKFYGQNGAIEIVPSIYVKEGFAYLLAMDDYMRVGSTDITFRRPGQGDEFFRDVENAAALELRAYCDQAVFCQAPGRSVLIKNIVNS